jgi:hypothetical protein
MSEQTKTEKTRTIVIPVHPDDYNVPISLVHIPLSNGRYATICGPLAHKTLKALLGTLEACKDTLVTAPVEDFEI